MQYKKIKMKNTILEHQNKGVSDDWQVDNFVLNEIKRLRSALPRNTTVRYTYSYLNKFKISMFYSGTSSTQ